MTGFFKEKTVCFSGHRQIERGHEKPLETELFAETKRLIDDGYQIFISGMALGFDTMAAQCVIELKKRYDIKLVAAIPYVGQADRWNDRDRQRYFDILKQCDETVCISAALSSGCYKERNKFMVDNSSALITYFVKDKTGTAQTVNYARQKEVKITNLNDKMP